MERSYKKLRINHTTGLHWHYNMPWISALIHCNFSLFSIVFAILFVVMKLYVIVIGAFHCHDKQWKWTSKSVIVMTDNENPLCLIIMIITCYAYGYCHCILSYVNFHIYWYCFCIEHVSKRPLFIPSSLPLPATKVWPLRWTASFDHFVWPLRLTTSFDQFGWPLRF